MNLIQIVLLVIITFSGYPIGRFIASQTKEELKAGRYYFKAIMIFSFLLFLDSLLLFKSETQILLLASSTFIFLIAFASLKYRGKR